MLNPLNVHMLDDGSIERLLRAAKPQFRRRTLLPKGSELCNGRIKVVRSLGSGAVGTVYEAIDDGVRIALKTAHHSEQQPRIEQEFRCLSAVTHPNVVEVHELLADGDLRFFTMECVHGLPLHRYWASHRSRGGIPQESRAPGDRLTQLDIVLLYHLLSQLIDGVCSIHELGLLHSDLKPSNILVERDGRVVILDFDLGCDINVADPADAVVRPIGGTPGFIAPEQVHGAPPSTASDWYAVGVILYQLLTGRLPNSGSSLSVQLAKPTCHIIAPRDLAPRIPRELDALCCRLLHRDPAARPSGEHMRAFSQRDLETEPD